MFLKLLMRNFQMAYRTIRSVALRPFSIFKYKISSMTNISKLLNRIPKFFAALIAKLKMKPEKREDFVDAGPVFIAKSLIIMIIIAVIAIPLLIIYIGWPWFVSMFLTAKFYMEEPKLQEYSGKVELYYDEKLEKIEFKGRLKDGKRIGEGKEFFENGMLKYLGSYENGKYGGEGALYSEDGQLIYKGNFTAGLYNGIGELLLSDGNTYKGDFDKGKMTGKGQIFNGDVLVYEGSFLEGTYNGEGTEYYPSGEVKYKGEFKGGLYSGKGIMYNEEGAKVFEGSFESGLFNGEGRYYGKNNELVYAGNFVNGLYEGEGKLIFIKDSMWYEGSFTAGKASGKGKLYMDGMLFYEGSFADNMMSGNGTLTHINSGLTYSGLFENNDIAYGRLFQMTVEDIYKSFSTGLSEDTSSENYFYMYNQVFGVVLKFTYATESDPAKLVRAYTLPKADGVTRLKTPEDLKLHGTYIVGDSGEDIPDSYACTLLGVKSRWMNYYIASYQDYGACYWTDMSTGQVAVIEYYPVESTQAVAVNAQVESGNKSKPAERYAVYFSDLGLDMADFGSLGYGEQQ
jgi:hypothetical protein